jgi:hypothetical protein
LASGWQSWHWVPLLDTNGNRVVIPLGGVGTLQVTSGNNLNANYYMLVPAPSPVTLTASIVGGVPTLHFPSSNGSSYTVLYKNNLSDASWSTLSVISGDGTAKTVPDNTAGGQPHRFYKLQIQ